MRFRVLVFCADFSCFSHKNTASRRHRHIPSSGPFGDGFIMALPQRVLIILHEASARWGCLGSICECNTAALLGMGCCGEKTKQTPHQRRPWRDLGVRQDSCRLGSFQAARLANAAMGQPPPASCGSALADPWPLLSVSGRSRFSQTEPFEERVSQSDNR